MKKTLYKICFIVIMFFCSEMTFAQNWEYIGVDTITYWKHSRFPAASGQTPIEFYESSDGEAQLLIWNYSPTEKFQIINTDIIEYGSYTRSNFVAFIGNTRIGEGVAIVSELSPIKWRYEFSFRTGNSSRSDWPVVSGDMLVVEVLESSQRIW